MGVTRLMGVTRAPVTSSSAILPPVRPLLHGLAWPEPGRMSSTYRAGSSLSCFRSVFFRAMPLRGTRRPTARLGRGGGADEPESPRALLWFERAGWSVSVLRPTGASCRFDPHGEDSRGKQRYTGQRPSPVPGEPVFDAPGPGHQLPHWRGASLGSSLPAELVDAMEGDGGTGKPVGMGRTLGGFAGIVLMSSTAIVSTHGRRRRYLWCVLAGYWGIHDEPAPDAVVRLDRPLARAARIVDAPRRPCSSFFL